MLDSLLLNGSTSEVGMGISEYRIQKDPNPKQSGIQIEI